MDPHCRAPIWNPEIPNIYHVLTGSHASNPSEAREKRVRVQRRYPYFEPRTKELQRTGIRMDIGYYIGTILLGVLS